MLQGILSCDQTEFSVSLQDVLFVRCDFIHLNGCYVTRRVTQPEAMTCDYSHMLCIHTPLMI